MPAAAFTTPTAVPLRTAPRPALCHLRSPRPRVCRIRAGPRDTEPEPPVPVGRDEDDDPLAKEQPVEAPPLVGGTVAPADFEDVDDERINETAVNGRAVEKPPVVGREDVDQKKTPIAKEGVADVVSSAVEDLLEPGETMGRLDDASEPRLHEEEEPELSQPPEVVEKTPEVVQMSPDEGSEAPEATSKVELPSPEAEESESRKDAKKPRSESSVKMTPEQIEKAKNARAEAAKAAEEKEQKKKEQTKRVLENAEKLIVKLGTKTRAFELGETARARAEVFVEDTIQLGTKDEATQQDKLKSSAASAAKSVVSTVTKGWEEKVAPKVQEQLPEEFASISKKALAAIGVGLFVAVALLPSLFSGGQPAKQAPAKKKLDAETAVLEKKLQRDRAVSTYGSRSAAEKSIFPPEEKTASSMRKAPEAPAPPKVAEVPKVATIPEAAKVPAPSGPVVAEVTPPKPVPVPVPAPKPEPLTPAQVTPAMVMASLTKALGSQSVLIVGTSFDSLSAEPTVILEVTKAFHRLPSMEQKAIAQKALKSTRTLGYERVSFIEQETGLEVAHAGMDIDLEDETENLRAQLASMRKQSDKLAMQSAEQEAEIDALNSRLGDERDEFAGKRNELDKIISKLQGENKGLLDDIAEAKEEISKMPDRLALEDRTLEAEKRSEKLTDTVEMLSKQLATARDQEAQAKQQEAESLVAVKDAERMKAEALASVAGEIERAQTEAQRRATEEISVAQKEARQSVAEADTRVRDIEQTLAKTESDAAKTLDETTQSYEKRLAEQQSSSEKDVQTIQKKYESLLEDVQRKAKAELDAFQKDADRKMAAVMKEAKSTANALTKERDQAIKETERAEAKGEKAAAKAAREKDGLQAKITRLEAKLKGKEVPEAAEVGAAEGAGAN